MDDKDKLIAKLQKQLMSALMMRDHEIGVKRRGKMRMTEILANRTQDNRRLRNIIAGLKEQLSDMETLNQAAINLVVDMWPSCPNFAVYTDSYYCCALCGIRLHTDETHKPDCLWDLLLTEVKKTGAIK